ncbi:unnamed protein product, partial [Ixodes hexagonus]
LGPCAGVSDSTFKSMGATKRVNWQCKTCRRKDSRSGLASSLEDSQLPTCCSATLDEVNSKLDMLLSIKTSVDKLLPLPAKVDDLLSLKPALEELKGQVGDLQASVDFCSGQYDTLLDMVKGNEERTGNLESELASVKGIVGEQSYTITQLQSDLSDMQSFVNKLTLKIHGVPCGQNEDLFLLLNNTATTIALPVPQQSDLNELRRLPSKRGTAAPIPITFASCDVREKWMSCRSRLRKLPKSDALSSVFFNEHLSRVCRELFWKARVREKEMGYKFVWVRSGKSTQRRRKTWTLSVSTMFKIWKKFARPWQ